MFRAITQQIPRDPDFSDRVFNIEIRRRIQDGTFYDHLLNEFFCEENRNGHIPMRDRVPSTPYNLCGTVVKDGVALTFAEGRFPAIDSTDPATRNAMNLVVRNCSLQQIMIDAAISGCVGSVSVLMRVLTSDDQRAQIYFEKIDTQFLTPFYATNAPDKLIKVVQRYKIKGMDLLDAGYNIAEQNLRSDFWFQRIFDADSEQWFLPMLVSESKDKNGNRKPMIEDADKRNDHKLGFVPLVWIKNLPGGKGYDGACTFEQAIDISIELDYQLSQAGRALKYSGDPLLLIKETTIDGDFQRDASNAMRVSHEGDAKYLEINGKSIEAVLNYCRALREMGMEAIGGNRAPIDKLSLPQSGRAMECLMLPLVQLADMMRGSYGEHGLKPLLKMVAKAQAKFGNLYAGDDALPKLDGTANIALRWTDFFPPTDNDRAQQATTLTQLVGAGLMSRETAVKTLAQRYDVESVEAEISLIEADQAKHQAEAMALAEVQAKKNIVPQDVEPQAKPTNTK